MKEATVTFLKNVKEYAKYKGIKLRDIEKDAGVTVGYISRLVKGDRETQIGLDTAVRMAMYIGGASLDMFTSKNWAKEQKRKKLEKQMQEIKAQIEELEREQE